MSGFVPLAPERTLQFRLLPVLIHDVMDGRATIDRREVIDGVLRFMGDDTAASVAHMLDNVVDQVVQDVPTFERVGDLFVDLEVVAEQAGPFAHRLSAEEIDRDELDLDPDLSLLAALAGDAGGLHRGEDGWPLDLRVVRSPGAGRGGNLRLRRYLRGPAGWLGHFAPGDLVSASVYEGLLHLTHVEGSADVTDRADGANADVGLLAGVVEGLDAAVAAAQHGDEVPVDAVELMASGLVTGWLKGLVDADVGAVVEAGVEAGGEAGVDGGGGLVGLDTMPFGEVLEAAGYEVDGPTVAKADLWEPYAKLAAVIRRTWAHQHHDRQEMAALVGLLEAFANWSADRSMTPASALIAEIHRHEGVAFCVEEELLDDAHGRMGDLRTFLDSFEVPRGRRAAILLTLKAVAAEADGDLDVARELTDEALAADPTWPPAIETRFREVSARGNLAEAVRLLQVVRSHEDRELGQLRAIQKALSPDTPRNAPCPCGSGRKFKQCHLGKMELSPLDRAWWISLRAHDHQDRCGPLDRDLLVGGGERSPLEEAPHLVEDAWFHDHGGMAAWLSAYGSVLDPADSSLAESWLEGQRPGVYRVDATAGNELTVTDLGRGDSLVVSRRGETHNYLEPGDVAWMRPVPCGDLWWTGTVTRLLSDVEIEALLALGVESGDPAVALARYQIVAGIHVVPELSDLGRPVVFCAQSWSFPDDDEDAVRAVLDEVAEADAVVPISWTWSGPDRDRGWLHLIRPSDHFDDDEAGLDDEADDGEADFDNDANDGDVVEVDLIDTGVADEVDLVEDPGPDLADALRHLSVLAVTRTMAERDAVAAMIAERFPTAIANYSTASPRRRRIAIEADEKILREATYGPDEDWLDDDDYDDDYDDVDESDG